MLYIYCKYKPEHNHNKEADFINLLMQVAQLHNVKVFYDEFVGLSQETKEGLIDFVQRADLVPSFPIGYKNFYQWENGSPIPIKEDDFIIKHITEKDGYEEHECLLVQNCDELIYIICDDTKENISSFVQLTCCSTIDQLFEWYKNNNEVAEKDTNSRIPISQTALSQTSKFEKTDMISKQGTRVYRELKTNDLLHLDNFHKKEDAHIEVYNENWNFKGIYDLKCQVFTPKSKKQKARKLRIKAKR